MYVSWIRKTEVLVFVTWYFARTLLRSYFRRRDLTLEEILSYLVRLFCSWLSTTSEFATGNQMTPSGRDIDRFLNFDEDLIDKRSLVCIIRETCWDSKFEKRVTPSFWINFKYVPYSELERYFFNGIDFVGSHFVFGKKREFQSYVLRNSYHRSRSWCSIPFFFLGFSKSTCRI